MSDPAANAALHDAMGRLLRKNEALEIEKSKALARFEELENKLRKTRLDLKDANDRVVELMARVRALESKKP